MTRKLLSISFVLAILGFAGLAIPANAQTPQGPPDKMPVMRLRDIGTRADMPTAQNVVSANSTAAEKGQATVQSDSGMVSKRRRTPLLQNAFLSDFNPTNFLPEIVFTMTGATQDPNEVILPAGSTVVTTRLRPNGDESIEQYYNLNYDFTGRFGILVWYGDVLDGSATFGVYVRTPDGRSDSIYYYYDYSGGGTRFPKALSVRRQNGTPATLVISGRFSQELPAVMIDSTVVNRNAIVLATFSQVVVDLTLDPQFTYIWGGYHTITVKGQGSCDTLSQYLDQITIQPFPPPRPDGNPPAKTESSSSLQSVNQKVSQPTGVIIVGGLDSTDGVTSDTDKNKDKQAKKQDQPNIN